jgi:hypothetical protein
MVRQVGENKWFKSIQGVDFKNLKYPEIHEVSIPVETNHDDEDWRYVQDPYYTKFENTPKKGARYSMSENCTDAINSVLDTLQQLFPNDKFVVETYKITDKWELV